MCLQQRMESDTHVRIRMRFSFMSQHSFGWEDLALWCGLSIFVFYLFSRHLASSSGVMLRWRDDHLQGQDIYCELFQCSVREWARTRRSTQRRERSEGIQRYRTHWRPAGTWLLQEGFKLILTNVVFFEVYNHPVLCGDDIEWKNKHTLVNPCYLTRNISYSDWSSAVSRFLTRHNGGILT